MDNKEAITRIKNKRDRIFAKLGRVAIVDALDKAILALSTEPKTEWIPVSERLPKDREVILFSTKADIVFEGRYFDDNTDDNTGCRWYSFSNDKFVRNNFVTAWMPLPEPYKAESED